MAAQHRPGFVPAGPSHPEVRRYLDLRRGRGSGQEAAVEGVFLLRRAMGAAAGIQALFVCSALLRGDDVLEIAATVPERRRFEVSDRLLRRMVSRDGPDGVAAIVGLTRHDLADLILNSKSRLLVGDGLESPGNLGSVIRAADGAAAMAVLLTGRTPRRDDPRVLRGSMGAVFSVATVEADAEAALRWLRERGARVIGAEPRAALSYRQVSYAGPVALVLGSERLGLSELWRRAADVLVRIPMLGSADSLNVGHAAALLLYEAARWHGEV